MSHRQTVEFLRRRYAAAILCDDADTAGRLRAQLDGIMNHVCAAGRPGEVPEAQARPPEALPEFPDVLPRSLGALAAARSPGQPGPRLHLATPVTGLLEGFGRGRREP
jgi:hypothetical protein